MSCLQNTHFRSGDIYRLKVKKWKKIFYPNENKIWSTILISDKIDFKDCCKRQRTLHNDQGINPRRKYNSCKYIYNQHRSTSIYKGNTNK